MRNIYLFLILVSFPLLVCAQKEKPLTRNPKFDSIAGKPVNYYIKQKECSKLAIDYYYGKFIISDDDSTYKLLSLATTDNNNLRPFYRWILNEILAIADGGLSEMDGIPPRKYAEKFPKEFFEYIDMADSDGKYAYWLKAITNSGLYDGESYKEPEKSRNNLIRVMKQNCKDCDKETNDKIVKFANDLF